MVPGLKMVLRYIDILGRKLEKQLFAGKLEVLFVQVAAFIEWLKQKFEGTDSLGHLNLMSCCTSVKNLGTNAKYAAEHFSSTPRSAK